MAPFPWHFGGQRYQNILLMPKNVGNGGNLNLRMCFDVSHSKLTCEHFGLDFYEFSEQVAQLLDICILVMQKVSMAKVCRLEMAR